MRTAALVVSPLEIALAALAWLAALSVVASGAPLHKLLASEETEEQHAPADPDQAPPAAPAIDAAEAERQAVWNSPEMRFARAYLVEYFRTSRQSPPAVEQAYLKRLETLSAGQLRTWLGQMAQQHRQIAVENRRFEEVRRQALTTAAAQQSPFNPAPQRSVAPTPRGNYVLQRPVQRPFSGPSYDPRFSTLRSLEIVHYLDTLQIREDVAALRAGAP